jgi:hypothetical protein
MIDRLQPILSLLDEGIAIYRRDFLAFTLVTAIWFVPVAVATGALIAAVSWLETDAAILIALLGLLLLFPLAIYLVGGLSRAAVAAIEGRAVRVREALAIKPLRIAQMGCFTIVFMIIAQIASYLVTMVCVCPLYLAGAFFIGGLGALSGGSGGPSAVAFAFLGILLAGVYALGLVIGGATYSSLIYALQPWVQEAGSFGESFQRSFALLGYHFRRSMLVWGLTALLVAAAGVTVTATVGLILPLPLALALGDQSPIAQALSVVAWLLGLMIVLPPLPIWMALFYRRNRAARDGADLDAAVQVWWGAHFGGTENREPRTENRPA